MRDLEANLIELDERWDFIGKKHRRVRQDDPEELDLRQRPEKPKWEK